MGWLVVYHSPNNFIIHLWAVTWAYDGIAKAVCTPLGFMDRKVLRLGIPGHSTSRAAVRDLLWFAKHGHLS